MVQFNPEFVKTRSGKTMVVLTLTKAEYRRVCELLDDVIDIAEFGAAKKVNVDQRWYTTAEARNELGLPVRKRKVKGSSGKRGRAGARAR